MVRKTTEMRVRNIQNEASEIRKNATAEAHLIAAKAEADAKYKVILTEEIASWSIVSSLVTSFHSHPISFVSPQIESAHREGLKKLYSDLGVTDDKDKSSITFLRSLSGNDDVHISVGFTDLRLQVPGQG